MRFAPVQQLQSGWRRPQLDGGLGVELIVLGVNRVPPGVAPAVLAQRMHRSFEVAVKVWLDRYLVNRLRMMIRIW